MDEQQLSRLITATNQHWLSAAQNRLDSKQHVRKALQGAFELALANQLSECVTSPEALKEIAKSATLVKANFDLVERLVASEIKKASVTWQHDDWETWRTLCMLRSQLEYMKLLYGEQYHRTFLELRMRKSARTKFLDSLRDSLKQRMDNADEDLK